MIIYHDKIVFVPECKDGMIYKNQWDVIHHINRNEGQKPMVVLIDAEKALAISNIGLSLKKTKQ
jgi:hypothetical protein